ncbi:hypothetical protein SH528x_003737 [Novipirellula sp. SH528]|uniref:hypothetical protein n=1 Tax=Novipirellula sp. SH528 TaxID=3454466 RepID=UPI003FA17527
MRIVPIAFPMTVVSGYGTGVATHGHAVETPDVRVVPTDDQGHIEIVAFTLRCQS